MSEPSYFPYRAFISYSHADSRVAGRIHARLEAFPIDKDLIGRETPMGPIPKTLRPIFRDRADFVAGESLGAQTQDALDQSAALVVLASPNSAKSGYVNEEVRLFKSRHPERPVIPLIIDGEPGGGDRECFPPALRFRLDASGAVSNVPENVLAADLRESADGFHLALAKVVARLIGLSPDDVFRRAERERRRQGRVRAGIVAALLCLSIIAGGLFWRSQQQQITLDEINALAEKYSLIQPAQAGAPSPKKGLVEAITAIAQGAAVDPRKAQALRLLREGKIAEAEPLLLEAIEERAKRREREIKEDAADYRHLASLAAVHDPGKARDYYAKAVQLDPDNPYGLFWDGWLQLRAKNLDAAEKSYRALSRLDGKGANEHQIFWARNGLGDIFAQRGNLPAALKAYGEARATMERLSSSDSGNAQWQRDLSVSYNKIGDVFVRQGNLPEALKSFSEGLAIAERLSSSDSGNAEWQRDLSISYDRIGDVLVKQGNLPEALKSYRVGLAIAERLSSSDSGNAQWQFDLGISNERIGDVQMKMGDLGAALRSYGAKRDIISRLASSDSGNAGWQRDLSVSYNKIGDVLVRQGNLPEALKSYRAGLAIAERLSSSDSGNAEWRRDLSISYDRVGDVLVSQGNLPEALKSYRAGLAIAERLSSSDSGNADWQRDLSVSYAKLGRVYINSKDFEKARDALTKGRAIISQLVAEHPDWAEWKDNLVWFDHQLAALGPPAPAKKPGKGKK